jgi:16S rRNA (uracil1498-N3)-methyltransferase
MRRTRVYSPQPLSSGTRVQLGVDSARHLITVLRLKAGDELILFNGEGGEFAARISTASKQLVEVAVGGHCAEDRESPLALTLGIGISRGERMDFVIQKAAELGVTGIAPLMTERTEVRLKGDRTEKKQRHWQQVIVSACEQCGRNRLPELLSPQPLAQWLSAEPRAVSAKRFVLHHRADITLRQLAGIHCTEATLLVGPEGGLSDQEIDTALAAGFQPLRLGPRVLRTETAPLAAISVLQSIWGDWL